MLICCNVYAGNQWRQGGTEKSIAGSESPSDIDTVSYENIVAPNERLLSNYQEGCKVSYSSATTISIALGEIMLSNSGGTIRLMQQNTSAKTATFSNIDTGAEEASKTYYVYAYQGTVTDTDFDIIISLSSSAPTGATYYARLGSFYNNADSDIEQISNDNESLETSYILGQGTYYKIDTGSVSVASGSTTAVSFSFTFDAAPLVYATFVDNFVATDESAGTAAPASITTTGCTMANTDNATHTVQWLAIGQYKL